MPRMTGSRFFAETLHGYGVSHVFFVPTILTPALAAMGPLGITRVMTHGEKAAAYMADGYARARRGLGICMAQTVGAANLAAGLKDARLAGSPVVALSGGPVAETRYRHAYQEIVDLPMFGPVTKHSGRVDAVERFPDLLRQAFRIATTGAPGPVHLELPGEQGQAIDAEAELELIVEETFARVPPFRPLADPDCVREAARLLVEAARPVIVAGGGVATSDAGAVLVELAEKLQAPVATSLNAKGVIPDDHPLAVGVPGTYSRTCANRVVCEADLVLFVGSHAGGQVTHFWQVPPPGTPTIQLDLDPEELGRNYPNRVSLLGDARAVLGQLVAAVGRPVARRAWIERVQWLVAAWRTELEPLADSDAVPMRPERICRAIAEVLPADGVVVSDTGHAGMWSGQTLDLTRPGQRYIRAAGSLGWGLPAALGVKCGVGERPVVLFSGDGGFYYHLAELETAARYGINVVMVVNNNQSMNQEIRPFNAAYGGEQHEGFEMWNFARADLVKVAEGLGCVGLRVERPGELRDVLERAFAAERPVVVDAISDIRATAPRAWLPA